MNIYNTTKFVKQTIKRAVSTEDIISVPLIYLYCFTYSFYTKDDIIVETYLSTIHLYTK